MKLHNSITLNTGTDQVAENFRLSFTCQLIDNSGIIPAPYNCLSDSFSSIFLLYITAAAVIIAAAIMDIAAASATCTTITSSIYIICTHSITKSKLPSVQFFEPSFPHNRAVYL